MNSAMVRNLVKTAFNKVCLYFRDYRKYTRKIQLIDERLISIGFVITLPLDFFDGAITPPKDNLNLCIEKNDPLLPIRYGDGPRSPTVLPMPIDGAYSKIRDRPTFDAAVNAVTEVVHTFYRNLGYKNTFYFAGYFSLFHRVKTAEGGTGYCVHLRYRMNPLPAGE